MVIIYNKSITTGASKDFQEAHKLAQAMVVTYGMGSRPVFPYSSDKYKEMIDNDVSALVNEAYEVSKKIKRDFYINVQGDEPLIDKQDIERFLSYAKKNKSSVINAYTKIKDKKEYFSVNVPKVIFDKNKNRIR